MYFELNAKLFGAVGALASRSENQVMRIAMIYALMDCSDQIKVPHLKSAMALWKFSFQSIRYVFGDQKVIEDPRAQKIIKKLEDKAELTKSEVIRLFSNNISKNELDQLLDKLIESGYVQMEKVKFGNSSKATQLIKLVEQSR